MKTYQQGATLIVVLVLLTIMMFMGMALYRSSDLASLISGNVSSKQMATQVGDIGLAAAESVLRGAIPTADQAGFVLTKKTTDTDGIPNGGTAGWSAAASTYGFTYQYLIERLCDAAAANCTTTSIPKPANGAGSGGQYEISQMYRVTVKVTGPKNLESYIQALYSK